MTNWKADPKVQEARALALTLMTCPPTSTVARAAMVLDALCAAVSRSAVPDTTP
jgi:hypothetical protein